jgi:ribosomal protein L40E
LDQKKEGEEAMAMTTCKDCNAEMSTRANACPKCGRVYRGQPLSAARGLLYIGGGLLAFFGLLAWKIGC